MDERSRSTRRRSSRGQGGVTERTSRSVDRTIQIFVKVEGRTLPVEMSPSDRVDDIVARVMSSARGDGQDMYVMCEGTVVRR